MMVFQILYSEIATMGVSKVTKLTLGHGIFNSSDNNTTPKIFRQQLNLLEQQNMMKEWLVDNVMKV